MLSRWRDWWRRPDRSRRLVFAGLVILLLVLLGIWLARLGWAAHHLRLAEQALDQHDYAAARQHLTCYLDVWPEDARNHFRAARAARCDHSYKEAEEHLRLCRLYGWDGEAIAVERQLAALQRGDVGEEPALWARVEADDPNTLAILEVLIQFYIDSYRLSRAREALNRYLRRRPDDVKALLGRGFVAERQFDFAGATSDYRRAVELAPANPSARLHLAQMVQLTGGAGEARPLFQELRGAEVDQAAVLVGLAHCDRELANFDEAQQILDELLATHPDNAAALRERGMLELDQDQPARAEPLLRRAVAADPHDRLAYHNLFLCLQRQNKPQEAEAVRLRLEKVHGDLKRLDHLLTHEVQRAPNDPTPRYEAGTILLRNGQDQEALRWFGLALRCDPLHRPTHQALADYFENKGQAERAAYHRRLANSSAAPFHKPKAMKES